MLIVAFGAFIIGGTFLDVTYHELLYQLVAMVIIAKALSRQGTQMAVQDDDQIEPRSRTQVRMEAATKRGRRIEAPRVPVAGS